MKDINILIVDDDPAIRYAFGQTFEKSEYTMHTASNGREAMEKVGKVQPSLVFLDIAMPGMDGLETLEKIIEGHPDLPVVIITGFGNMQTAIRAMQLGAFDYLSKPLDIEKVRLIANRVRELIGMRRKIDDLQRRIEEQSKRQGTVLIGQSQLMQEVYKKIGIVSTTPNVTNILITGETGTGKELVAKAIHESSLNAAEPFVAINCTVLPKSLLESELFGHEKGAFTGADVAKPGKFEAAGSGILFLDEIGDMPLSLQKKMLRVIQERTFTRLGSNRHIPLKARIITATHHDLKKAVRREEFREDLFYRLNVIEINLPPLKQRMEDIPLLVNYFLAKYNHRFGKKISHVSDEAMAMLTNRDYPGNVRELENLIERAVALTRGNILTPLSFLSEHGPADHSFTLEKPQTYGNNFHLAKKVVVEEFEKAFLTHHLEKHSGNVSAAARSVSLNRQTFQRLMKKYDIHSADFRRN